MNLLLGSVLKREETRAHSCVAQDTAGDESVLESDSALHVRPAVVHGLGDWKEAVVHGARLRVVLGLAGGDELEKSLGGNVTLSVSRTLGL